jgi:hypothetical protein
MQDSAIMEQVKSFEIRTKEGDLVAVYRKDQLNEARKAIEGNGYILQYVLSNTGNKKMTFKKQDSVKVIKADNWLFDSVMRVVDIVDSQELPLYWCKTASGLGDWYFESEIILTDEDFTND